MTSDRFFPSFSLLSKASYTCVRNKLRITMPAEARQNRGILEVAT